MQPNHTSHFDPPARAGLLAISLVAGLLYACATEPTIMSVVVTPNSAATTSLGETVKLTASATLSDGSAGTGQAFTWTSSNGAVASVSSSGLVTAVAVGSATITASTDGVSGTATVSVQQVVVAIAVAPATADLDALGATVQLSAVALDARGNTIDTAFSWASSDQAVATVTGTGLVTALSNGSAIILASAGGVTASASIAVQQNVDSVAVTPAASQLEALGATVQLSATALDARGNTVGTAFSWTSSDQAVATVSETGLVTALSNGSATISASTSSKTALASITVEQVVAAITVTPTVDTLVSLGETIQAAAVAFDANDSVSTGHTFEWVSTDESVATVSNSGLITAVLDGSVTITATANGVSADAGITVLQKVATVDVSLSRDRLIILGDTSVLTAVAMDALANVMEGRTWAWTTSNASVATVNAVGTATAVGEGTATITATTDGVSGSGSLEVDPTPVARLDMPDSADAGGQVVANLVLLTAGTGHSTGAFAATLSWDQSVLQYNAGVNPQFYSVGVFDNTEGTLKVVVSEPAGIVGNLLAMTITFDVVGSSGSSTDISVAVDKLISAVTFRDLTAGTLGQDHPVTVR